MGVCYAQNQLEFRYYCIARQFISLCTIKGRFATVYMNDYIRHMKYLLSIILLFLFSATSCDSNSNSNSSDFSGDAEIFDSTAGDQVVSDGENYNGEDEQSTSDESQNDGRVGCPFCEGNGNVTCGSCDGRGKKHCGNCGGDGWDNNGNRCLNCDGGGIVACNTTTTCSACQGYGYGYLVPCSICNGTTKKEDGTTCTCSGQFASLTRGLLSDMLGGLAGNLPDQGVLIKEYPGYYFTYPNP